MSSGQIAVPSAWGPLRQSLFRALWMASVASNIGTWIQNVGAEWLMTTLAPSPMMVALMQTAETLPIFLLAIPAGAIADVIDRRRLLLIAQSWMLLAAAALSLLTLVGATTPWVLLLLTFSLGLGAAATAPAWQAVMPELVPRSELPTAVALNSVAFNIARAVGPALGGLLVAAVGSGAAFLLNALSFLGIIIVLYRWHRSPAQRVLPSERVWGAMRAGMRYVRHAPSLRAVLVRTVAFIFCGSALWSVLPLLARRDLGLSAFGYGVLLGCLGGGAVIGAAILPKLRKLISVDLLIALATVLFAAATLALAYMRVMALLYLAMILGGMAWMSLMSSFNVAAQSVVPEWVRARALAAYLLVFFGGLASGSAFWGVVATHIGIPRSLLCAALTMLAGLLTIIRYRLAGTGEIDLTPSLHWAAPLVVSEPQLEQPVLILVEYRIDLEKAPDFVLAMHDLRLTRRRDGAIRWGIFHDPADPGRYVETFLVESWIEHLRQHERFTVTDRVIEERVLSFHIGESPPVVSHLVAEELSS